MSQRGFQSDVQRDAVKYGHLLNALRRATQEIRGMQEQGDLAIDEVLEKLLPVIAKALDAEKTFVAKQDYDKSNGRIWFDLVAVHPDKELIGHHLEVNALLQALIQDGKPRVLDTLGVENPQPILGLELFQATSAILVRMQTINQTYVVGVCNKRHRDVGPFLASDRIALDSILELIAIGVRTEERRQREHKAIQQISETATRGNPDEVRQTIAQHAAEIAEVDYATVVTVNKNAGQLTLEGTWEVAKAHWQTHGLTLPLDESSLSGYVALTRRSHYAADVRYELHYQPLHALPYVDVQSAYCVPLIISGETVATIYLASARQDGIHQEDREFVEQLAPHAAIALHHAQLLEETHRRLAIDEKVIRVQQAISDILTEQQVSLIPEILTPFVALGVFFIATYDEYTQMIEFPHVYERGRRVEQADQKPGSLYGSRRFRERYDLIDYVLEHHQPVLVNDFATWPDRNLIAEEFLRDVKSSIYVPMHRNEQVIGVIGVRGYERTHSYSYDELKLLTKIAPHIAIVIQNARTYEQRVRELQALSSFQQRISEIEDTEAEEVQNVCAEARVALQAVDIDTANIFIALYRPEIALIEFPLVYEYGELVPDAQKRVGTSYSRRPLGDRKDIYEWMIRYRRPLLAKTRAEIDSWRGELEGVEVLPSRSHSWLGAPMIASNQLVGMIAVRNFHEEYIYTENHVELLKTIASQAATAIRNAQLYQKTRNEAERFSAVYEAGKKIAEAGLDLDSVFQAILDQAVKATDAHFGTLQLVQGENLEFAAAWPPEQRSELVQQHGSMPINGPGITARAARENRAQLVDDVSQVGDFVSAVAATRSELAVALRHGGVEEGRPVGVLNVEHRAMGGFDKEDQRFLIALSNLAVAALQNARQATELGKTRAIAVMGAWGADVVHEINTKVGDIRRSVQILRDRVDLHQDSHHRLKMIDDYAASLALPELPEQPPEPGRILPPHHASVLDAVILAELAEFRQRRLRPHFEHRLECPEMRVAMHELWLRRVLRHFLTNAIKNIPPERANPRIVVMSKVDNGIAEVSIEDNGKGVRPEIRHQLFHLPIVHVDNRMSDRPGRGLVLVSFVTQLHGGVAELAWSEPEQGSRFQFKIPLV